MPVNGLGSSTPNAKQAEGLVTFCTRGELSRRPPPQLANPRSLSANRESSGMPQTQRGILQRRNRSGNGAGPESGSVLALGTVAGSTR